MSANAFLIDAASRHSLFIQRYAAGLERAERRAFAEMFDRAERVLSQYDLTSLIGLEAEVLRSQISRIFINGIGDRADGLIDEFINFAIEEAEFNKELLGDVVSVPVKIPSIDQIRNGVVGISFGFQRNLTLSRALEAFGARKTRQAIQVLRDGVLEGLTHNQIVKRFVELLPLYVRQSGALVRTGVNHVSTVSRMDTLEENKDLFDGYEWVSTLDARTSLICMARDGIVYNFSEDSPLPPAHYSCRSTIIPKVKDKFNLLKGVDSGRPSVGATGAQKVSSRMTYSGWLRKQPASFQDEVLGEAKAKLFRQGKLALTHFVDESGKEYSLDRLRSLRPLAFERANLN